MTTAVPAKRIRTRAALLTAIQELLLDPAAPALSVPQVVSRARVAQGTFYNYFESLPDAVDAVGALIIVEHARVLEAVTADAGDHAEVVSRSARQTLMLMAHRPDVGRLLFDSGLPADRFANGVRAHLRSDLRRGVDAGVFAVADFDVICTVCAGVILGASLDLYRRRLTADAIPDVAGHLLGLLGVSPRTVRRLISAPQEFRPWRALPLSPAEET